MKIKNLIIGMLLFAFAAIAANDLSIQSSNNWVSYYGYLQMNGTNVSVGSVISAYDVNGVLCGRYTVDTEGQYGLMFVYGDDDSTPEDEGPLPGQLISVFLNDTLLKKVVWPGHPSMPQQINFSVWYQTGEVVEPRDYLDKRILFLKHITLLDSEMLTTADDLVVSVTMENTANYDLEDLRMVVEVDDLGEWIGTSRFDLEEGDTTTKSVALPLEFAEPGFYEARITVSNDRVKRVRHRDFIIKG